MHIVEGHGPLRTSSDHEADVVGMGESVTLPPNRLAEQTLDPVALRSRADFALDGDQKTLSALLQEQLREASSAIPILIGVNVLTFALFFVVSPVRPLVVN